MKRAVLAALLFVAAGAVVFDAPARAANAQVHAASNTFNDGGGCLTAPGETTTIAAGDSVTWHNCDTVAHTITSDDDGATFNQPLRASNDPNVHDVSITFREAGNYPYHCTIHGAGMKGTIVVTGGSSTTATTQTTPTTRATTTPTTAKATTTTKPTTTTTVANTTTSDDLNGVFADEPSADPTTTVFSTDTTRALGTGGDEGTSAGVVAGLILGLGAIGTAVALVIRRMRAGTPPI